MKKGLKKCPFCGNPRPEVRCYPADGVKLFRDRYAVLCNYDFGGCGAEGGWGHSPCEAMAMWNQRRRKWRNERD